MDPERFKPLLIRDKKFLEELYQSSSLPKSKQILIFADDSKLKTLITFLHLVSTGSITIKKENFEKLENKHLKMFRKHFDKKSTYKKFLNLERQEKIKLLSKLIPILPFLLYTLFNED